VLLVLVAIVVVLVVAVGGLMASMFMGHKKADEVTLSDGSKPILDGYVAAFAIPVDDTGNRVILVDCGNDKDAVALKKALAGKSVAGIFITHGHPDHVNGCNQFPGAPIYASKDEIPAMSGQEAFHGPLTKLFGAKDSGVKVTTPLEDNADVVVDGVHVHAFALPGHTKGSMAYAIKKTVYFGDGSSASSDGKMEKPAYIVSDDQALGVQSLNALPAKLAAAHVDGIENYAFAHSGPLKADPALLTSVKP
jgi:glyoxylase-like metal-dependent hydrolase (beta-lactamase superfamily II)